MEKVIGVLLLCMGCGKEVYFSSDRTKRPTTVHHKRVPIHEAMKMEGTQARCIHCNTINETYIDWAQMPPTMHVRAPGTDNYYGKWETE